MQWTTRRASIQTRAHRTRQLAGEEESNPCVSPRPMKLHSQCATDSVPPCCAPAPCHQQRGPAVPRGMAGHGSQGAPQQRSGLLGGRPSRHVRIARRSSPERRNLTPACLHAP